MHPKRCIRRLRALSAPAAAGREGAPCAWPTLEPERVRRVKHCRGGGADCAGSPGGAAQRDRPGSQETTGGFRAYFQHRVFRSVRRVDRRVRARACQERQEERHNRAAPSFEGEIGTVAPGLAHVAEQTVRAQAAALPRITHHACRCSPRVRHRRGRTAAQGAPWDPKRSARLACPVFRTALARPVLPRAHGKPTRAVPGVARVCVHPASGDDIRRRHRVSPHPDRGFQLADTTAEPPSGCAARPATAEPARDLTAS